jgi:glycogen debranching enzyme
MNQSEKSRQAMGILASCIGNKGIWASSDRYKYQCWTRDFVIAVLPLILETEDPYYMLVAERHLDQLRKRQKPNGQIPILFLDNTTKWLKIKVQNSIQNKRMSFMLKQFLNKDGVFNLTPWTKDSELLYLLGVGLYYQKTGNMEFIERHCKSIDRAFKYIENNLLYKGLIMGSDWRDTRPDYMRTMLLTNNCFLAHAYELLGMTKQANDLKDSIRKNFWNSSYFVDFIGSNNFDTFGNALAVLTGVAKDSDHTNIIISANKLRTGIGFKLNGVTLPPKSAKEAELMSRIKQNGVIWPYIHGFMTLALQKMNAKKSTERALQQMTNLNGFYEFYNPDTGEGHGSKNQLWSACLYLRCTNTIHI